jgi:uncharacterized repeat protein (TIGR01451 family)
VTSATLDPNNSNNFAHTDTTVSTQADLGLTLTSAPNPVVAGTALTYSAMVTNAGPSTARTITLVENLDANAGYQSASISNGGAGTCAQVVGNPHQIQCQLNDLDPGQSVTVYTQVLVSPSAPNAGMLTTVAQVSTSSGDPNPGNNTATALTGIQTAADLSATFTAPSHLYAPSSTVTFTATTTDNGPSDAQAVVLTVTLPGTKIGHYVSDNGGTPCTHTANATTTTVQCTYPTLPAGGLKSVQVVYFFQGNQKIQTGSDNVTSTTNDPNPANNTATWTVGPK